MGSWAELVPVRVSHVAFSHCYLVGRSGGPSGCPVSFTAVGGTVGTFGRAKAGALPSPAGSGSPGPGTTLQPLLVASEGLMGFLALPQWPVLLLTRVVTPWAGLAWLQGTLASCLPSLSEAFSAVPSFLVVPGHQLRGHVLQPRRSFLQRPPRVGVGEPGPFRDPSTPGLCGSPPVCSTSEWVPGLGLCLSEGSRGQLGSPWLLPPPCSPPRPHLSVGGLFCRPRPSCLESTAPPPRPASSEA